MTVFLCHQSCLVTFRTIGGVLDFFVYSGPTPEDVMAAHWSIVGRPAAPPAWALGFHLCRWGYDTDKDLSGQIQRMRDGNLIWRCVAYAMFCPHISHCVNFSTMNFMFQAISPTRRNGMTLTTCMPNSISPLISKDIPIYPLSLRICMKR